MFKYNVDESKTMLIVLVVLIIFASLVMKAFDIANEQNAKLNRESVPKTQTAVKTVSVDLKNNDTKSDDDIDSENDEENIDEDIAIDTYEMFMSVANKKIKEQELEKAKAQQLKESMKNISKEDLVPIEELNIKESTEESLEKSSVINSQSNELETKFVKIKALRNERNYEDAIAEYEAIIKDNPENIELLAKCYDGIAECNAILRRFGSAIRAAQRAYNMQPTSTRDLFLAKLYYKVGEIDKSTTKINEVLKKDFREE